MKVAVCISGQARAVEENFSNLRETLILPNNADVFVHTWFDEEDVGKTFCNKSGVCNQTGKKESVVLKKQTGDIIRNLYRPTLFQMDRQIQFVSEDVQNMNTSDPKHPYRNRWSIRPQNTFSMFWSIFSCNNLKRVFENTKNKKYDAVIRARFDVILEQEYRMTDYDPSNIYIDSHSHTPYSKQDTFAFSSSENMDHYSSTYFQIPSLLSQGVEFCPEILLGANLALSKIPQAQITNKQAPSYDIYR